MDYDSNVYYYPDKWGLAPLGELGARLGYDFDIFAVWKDDHGNVYYAHDSGCSCPTPFEDFNSLEDLGRVTDEEGWEEFQEAVDQFAGDEYRRIDPADKTQLLARVAEVLRSSRKH